MICYDNRLEHVEKSFIELGFISYKIDSSYDIQFTLLEIYHNYANDIHKYQWFTGINEKDFLWINRINYNYVSKYMIDNFKKSLFKVLVVKYSIEKINTSIYNALLN